MTTRDQLNQIVRDELGHRGYVVNVTSRREGEYFVGSLHVTSAETDETVAKVVGVGNLEDLHLCFGVDAEGSVRDAIVKLLGAWEGMRALIPTMEIKAPRA